jgi:hypothetical protein
MRLSVSRFIDSTPVKSPFWSFQFVRSYHYVPAIAILLLFVTGGTGYFAQGSLPGDALYPMKINVNEKMETFLAVTPKAAAEVDAIQANRRLTEAETLAVQGKLTPEQNTEIKNSFSAKVTSLNTNFQRMQEKGDSKDALEVLNNFDMSVQGKIASLSEAGATSTTASDIVAFIQDNHDDGRNASRNSKVVAPQAATFGAKADVASDTDETGGTEGAPPEAATMSLMSISAEATSAPASTTATSTATTTATTTKPSSASNQKQSSPKKSSSSFQGKIMWSWKIGR